MRTSKTKRAPSDPATAYARSVVSGKTTAGKLVIAACERHLRDIKSGRKRGLIWSRGVAQDALDFYGFCRQYKGVWSGKPLVLSPWQEFCIGSLFGWLRKDGTRRFRKGLIAVGRKNGKTTMLAPIGLLGLLADGEEGPEIYAAATKYDQARILLEAAMAMVDKSPSLSKRLGKKVNALYNTANYGKFVALGKDSERQDGLNPSIAIIDELHAHPDSGMFDVLVSGMGARTQPLIVSVTTAGNNSAGFGKAEWDYVSSVVRGILDNDAYFGYIAELDKDDDPYDEAVWVKANPNLGVSVYWDYMRQQAKEAKDAPHKTNEFLTKNLNKWVSQAVRWMPMASWDRCSTVVDPEALAGKACYAGLDLSTTTDITAFVMVFQSPDGLLRVYPRMWIPEDTVAKHAKTDKAIYDSWVRSGCLLVTPGAVLDYQFIRAEINRCRQKYDVKEIAFDRYNSSQLVRELTDDGAQMVAVSQGIGGMSAPMKELLRMVLTGQIAHGGHPVMRWMADNVVALTDANENIKPDKSKSVNRIDGIVALIMALDRVNRHQEEAPSAYETRGIRVL